MQVKFEEWTLSLQKGGVFAKNGGLKKKISIEEFEEKGMLSFPAELIKLIRRSVRHSNTYDRFLDKYDKETE